MQKPLHMYSYLYLIRSWLFFSRNLRKKTSSTRWWFIRRKWILYYCFDEHLHQRNKTRDARENLQPKAIRSFLGGLTVVNEFRKKISSTNFDDRYELRLLFLALEWSKQIQFDDPKRGRLRNQKNQIHTFYPSPYHSMKFSDHES